MESSRPSPAAETIPPTFESLGIIPPLLAALERVKFTHPTAIQAESIPFALEGRDIIGVAETVRTIYLFERGRESDSRFLFVLGLWEDSGVCVAHTDKVNITTLANKFSCY